LVNLGAPSLLIQTFHEMTVAPYWKMSQVVALLRPCTNFRVLIWLIFDFPLLSSQCPETKSNFLKFVNVGSRSSCRSTSVFNVKEMSNFIVKMPLQRLNVKQRKKCWISNQQLISSYCLILSTKSLTIQQFCQEAVQFER